MVVVAALEEEEEEEDEEEEEEEEEEEKGKDAEVGDGDGDDDGDRNDCVLCPVFVMISRSIRIDQAVELMRLRDAAEGCG